MAEQDLEQLMEELKRKKAKIALMKEVKEYVDALSDPKDFEGVAGEVKDLFGKFIERAIDETSMVKKTAAPLKPAQRESVMQAESEVPAKPIQPQTDLVDFVRQYGHFANKKVSAQNTKGLEVMGVAREVQYPHVMVATDAGTYEPVIPETLKVIGG